MHACMTCLLPPSSHDYTFRHIITMLCCACTPGDHAVLKWPTLLAPFIPIPRDHNHHHAVPRCACIPAGEARHVSAMNRIRILNTAMLFIVSPLVSFVTFATYRWAALHIIRIARVVFVSSR